MSMKITLPSVANPMATDCFNNKFIWDRRTIINGEEQMYMDMVEDPAMWRKTFLPITDKPNGGIIVGRTADQKLVDRYGQSFTSGLVTTHRKLAFKYGYVKCVVRLPNVKGVWPALWLLSEFAQWPQGVPMLPEVDIMEFIADGNIYNSLHHYNGFREGQQNTMVSSKKELGKGIKKVTADELSRLMTFEMYWTPSTMTFKCNGDVTDHRNTPADMHNHFHFLMNLAIGGGWPAKPNPADYNNGVGYEIHHVEITSDDWLFMNEGVPPESCTITEGETIPSYTDEMPRDDTDTPVQTLEVGSDVAFAAPGAREKAAQAAQQAQAVEAAIQSDDSPVPQEVRDRAETLLNNDPTASSNLIESAQHHAKMAENLMKHGWFMHHNKQHRREIMRHYLTGKKTQPVLDSPELVMNKESVDTAWNAIIDMLWDYVNGLDKMQALEKEVKRLQDTAIDAQRMASDSQHEASLLGADESEDIKQRIKKLSENSKALRAHLVALRKLANKPV